MLVWEHEHPATHYAVHNLLVLCFHLQHPSRYSPDGLRNAKTLLVDFVERGVSTEEIRRRSRDKVDSGKRGWKVTGSPGAQGAYQYPVRWKMTAADVYAGGVDEYVENIQVWARSVLKDLRESHNLE